MEENKNEKVEEEKKVNSEEKAENTENTSKVEEKKEEKEEIKVEENSLQDNTNEHVEKVKNEAKETIKQVKEQMKDVNFKEEAKATKGFVSAIIKEPLEKVKEIASDTSNKYFKTAIILVIVWIIAYFFTTVPFNSLKYYDFGKGLWTIVKAIITPAISIACLSLVVLIMNLKSENKKSLVTIITSVTTAKLPIIVSEVIGLLGLISSEVYKVTARVDSLASMLSAVMLYFAVKGIFGLEDDKKAFMKFAIIYGIFMIVSLVLSFLQIVVY
ncbi:MAG: hypothetical protein IJ809_07235 [Clostridia bacterium]|nr:hypothetical protein [Clostridia bacterium]